MKIQIAASDEEITSCLPVLLQLRPDLTAEGFLPLVRELAGAGYRLAFVRDEGEVEAVAGYRIDRNLFSGRFLYVDDLVTSEAARSRGYGKALFHWLVEQAREEGCASLQLDSGVQRFDAHRFYFRERMHIRSYHFSLPLPPG